MSESLCDSQHCAARQAVVSALAKGEGGFVLDIAADP